MPVADAAIKRKRAECIRKRAECIGETSALHSAPICTVFARLLRPLRSSWFCRWTGVIFLANVEKENQQHFIAPGVLHNGRGCGDGRRDETGDGLIEAGTRPCSAGGYAGPASDQRPDPHDGRAQYHRALRYYPEWTLRNGR